MGAGSDEPDWTVIDLELAKSVQMAELTVLPDKSVRNVAIACGSGGSLLSAALKAGCDLFLTGEATFHTCLEAEYAGCSMLLIGHYASERFAMEVVAENLSQAFPGIDAWASLREADPVVSLA